MAAVKMGQPAPPEYVELMLCRMYNCRPSELDEEDYERVISHVICWNMEYAKQGEKKEIS